MVQHVNAKQLEELVSTSQKPIFCDFWATWCGPCRMLAPVFEEISNKYADDGIFVKVDVDDEASESAAIKYGITSIPNVLVFKGGKVVDNQLGFVPEAALSALVERNL